MEITVQSTIDSTPQPSLLFPASAPGPRPLLVLLHQWSGDYRQDYALWHEAVRQRDWHLLQPDFRGINYNPNACASPLAQQDILDTVAHVLQRLPVDTARIYLAGESGGGHLSMMMAARYPQCWSAVSSWVGISDLAAWYHQSVERATRYAGALESVTGGKPGDSPDVDEQYRLRSPITWLHNIGDLPMEINAGIHDGHDGNSVPVSQTLHAFNAIARSHGNAPISEDEIARSVSRQREPIPAGDPFINRPIYLSRNSHNARCVLFEGGHDGLPEAGLQFLASHQRPTSWQST
jgi:dipeptidyl aminopeptidase/acylaminoacyl peptidase